MKNILSALTLISILLAMSNSHAATTSIGYGSDFSWDTLRLAKVKIETWVFEDFGVGGSLGYRKRENDNGSYRSDTTFTSYSLRGLYQIHDSNSGKLYGLIEYTASSEDNEAPSGYGGYTVEIESEAYAIGLGYKTYIDDGKRFSMDVEVGLNSIDFTQTENYPSDRSEYKDKDLGSFFGPYINYHF